MPYNPFDPKFADLPTDIPLFPLEGALLLPRGELPLNIFEPRYLAMVAKAMQGNRLIGIIQPHYHIGCIGRIVRFEEAIDGRYMIGLRGLCRFKLLRDDDMAEGGYKMARITVSPFEQDMVRVACLDLDKAHLKDIIRRYFMSQGLSMDWDLIDAVADEGLVTALAMACPFPPAEKQALLEADCCKNRAQLFVKLLEMAVAHTDPSAHRH